METSQQSLQTNLDTVKTYLTNSLYQIGQSHTRLGKMKDYFNGYYDFCPTKERKKKSALLTERGILMYYQQASMPRRNASLKLCPSIIVI